MKPDQYIVLRTILESADYAALSPAESVAALHVENIANPVAQTSKLPYLTKMTVLQLLSQDSAAKVLRYENLALVYASFDAQDHVSAGAWVQALLIIGDITAGEMATCISYISTPVPDPDYKALVSWVELNDVEPTVDDIVRARNLDKLTSLDILAQFLSHGYNAAVGRLDSVRGDLTQPLPTQADLIALFSATN